MNSREERVAIATKVSHKVENIVIKYSGQGGGGGGGGGGEGGNFTVVNMISYLKAKHVEVPETNLI